MIIRPNEKELEAERQYAEQQSQLNRQHELAVLERNLELERYKIQRESMFIKDLILLPVRLVALIPLSFAVLRKHQVKAILEFLRER